jgi:hypothetical protein
VDCKHQARLNMRGWGEQTNSHGGSMQREVAGARELLMCTAEQLQARIAWSYPRQSRFLPSQTSVWHAPAQGRHVSCGERRMLLSRAAEALVTFSRPEHSDCRLRGAQPSIAHAGAGVGLAAIITGHHAPLPEGRCQRSGPQQAQPQVWCAPRLSDRRGRERSLNVMHRCRPTLQSTAQGTCPCTPWHSTLHTACFTEAQMMRKNPMAPAKMAVGCPQCLIARSISLNSQRLATTHLPPALLNLSTNCIHLAPTAISCCMHPSVHVAVLVPPL